MLGIFKSIEKCRLLIFRRVPKDTVLRCRVERSYDTGDPFPSFTMFNELDGSVVLAARKRKKVRHTHYIVTTDASNVSKHSPNYVAKIKAHSGGNMFSILDTRHYDASSAVNKGCVDMAVLVLNTQKLPKELIVGLPLASNAEQRV